MRIGIVGSGHVGLVTAACFADMGHHVMAMDHDRKKVALLQKGQVPFYEPGLQDLVRQNHAKNRLTFTTLMKEAVGRSEVIFICVGTPPREDGSADLSPVENVTSQIAHAMDRYRLIVEKSTVPVETGHWLKRTVSSVVRKRFPFDIACNPEFLREGSAIHDFQNPDRIVIGVESKRAEKLLRSIYAPMRCSIVVTDITSAELIKHASNSFLATRISFINMVAQICEKVGADVNKVAEGMGLDRRIGRDFLNPGIGFGGFCFPKDLSAFIRIVEKGGGDGRILKSVLETNEEQKRAFMKKIKENLWNLNNKQIAVLGLSFKPNTDDMRFAPSLGIISELQREGARVRVFDPEAMPVAKGLFKEEVIYAKDPYDAAKKADALVILTEWNEFKELNLVKIKKLLKRPVIIDGRNIFDLERMKELGFEYISIGRPMVLDGKIQA